MVQCLAQSGKLGKRAVTPNFFQKIPKQYESCELLAPQRNQETRDVELNFKEECLINN